MDFVVVGLGLGAIGMLCGVFLLVGIAPWRERAARLGTGDAAQREIVLAARRRGFAQALIYAGGAILFATVGGLAGGLDDQTGAYLVVTTATVAALGLVVWSYLDRARRPIPAAPRTRSVASAPRAVRHLLPDTAPALGNAPRAAENGVGNAAAGAATASARPFLDSVRRPVAARNGSKPEPGRIVPLAKPLLAIAAHSVTAAGANAALHQLALAEAGDPDGVNLARHVAAGERRVAAAAGVRTPRDEDAEA